MSRVSAVAVGLMVLLAGCSGRAANSTATPDETIEIEMRELVYTPSAVTVKTGQTVRFRFRNAGTVDHDAYIGDADAQSKHEQEMRSPDMPGGHDMGSSGDSIVVKPGKTGELVYTFSRPGSLLIGCHEPGHYEAGMKMGVTVVD